MKSILLGVAVLLLGTRAQAETPTVVIPNGPIKTITTVPIKIPKKTAPTEIVWPDPKTTTMPPWPGVTPLSIPPAEYDRYYDGELTIVTSITTEEFFKLCPGVAAGTIGCARPNKNKCTIILLEDKRIRASGWTTGHVLRHEIGHCNGWPKDHPDMQPLPP